MAMLACIALPLALVLELLRALANRACMLEGLGVLDAYRRGIEILVENLGVALMQEMTGRARVADEPLAA